MTKDYFEYLFICDIYFGMQLLNKYEREMYTTTIANATNCFLNSQSNFFVIVKKEQ